VLKLSWNLTPSLPLGLWYSVGAFDINDNPRGKVVSICPPNTEYFRKARSDGILKWGIRCSGGFAPLLKRIVGIPGDLVEVSDRVLINRKEIAGSSIMNGVAKLLRGGEGFATKIRTGELWIMGDSEDSFDSRYFGALSATQSIFVKKTLLRF
jgi:conjugative transfer signal peptidase TraF